MLTLLSWLVWRLFTHMFSRSFLFLHSFCLCLLCLQDRNSVVKSLNALAQWLEENKGAGSELLELEEETKAFEAKLMETKAKVDPILGKLYTPSSSSAESDDSDVHEEL